VQGSRCRGRWAAALAALFLSGAAAQPSPDVGERLKACAACHGEGGNSVTPGVPSLAGQPRIFTENQLILFREGVRPQEPMSSLMRGISDREIVALAAYYAAAKPAAAAGKRDDALFRRGRALAQKMRCGNCHEPDFRGREQMPRLAGQREDYLYDVMLAYRENRRPGSDTMMSGVLYRVPDADIRAMAHFLAQSR
jgi:cytochrome c553